MISGMEERGIDHEGLLDLYIKTYNDCLKDHPQDMNVGLHLCRGNFKVRYTPIPRSGSDWLICSVGWNALQ